MQEGLARELDMQGIFNLIGDRVQELFNAQVVIIASFDGEYKNEYFNYLFENGEKVKADPRPLNKLQASFNRKETQHLYCIGKYCHSGLWIICNCRNKNVKIPFVCSPPHR